MAYKQKLNSRSKKRSRRGSHATKKRSGAGWILLILLILLVAGGAVLVTQFPEQAAQWLPDQLAAWLPTEAPAPTESTPEPTTTTTTAPRNVMVVTADSLNVRTGPGTDYDVLGTLSQGEEVVVLALEGDWYRIRYQSSEAYVHADYLMAVGETAATTEATTTTTTAPAIPTPEEGQVLYAVKIVDAAGNPVEGAYAQLCLETCVFQPTNAEGIAYFCLPEADYKVTIIGDEAAGEHHFEAGSYEITLTQSAQ